MCAPLRYAHAFGREEVFIFRSLAARLEAVALIQSNRKKIFPAAS
jgi:hypothetical protein